MDMAKTVEEYLETHERWSEELELLRSILIGTELEETVKWGMPTYTLQGKNLVGLAAFQEHCALWFHNGAAMADPDEVLTNAQEGKTKALRHWKFRKLTDVKPSRVKAYVSAAIEAGPAPAPVRKKGAVQVPQELKRALAEAEGAKAAFAALTPGKRREYAEHVGSAKREATRVSRAQKCIPMILAGAGLHDRYR